MSSPELAIAKASFLANIIRHNTSPQARDSAGKFQQLLNDTVAQCSPANVQKCKQWILGNIVASDSCLAAFAKYMTALSASFADAATTSSTNSASKNEAGLPSSVAGSGRQTSARRRRLHLLYVLSDVLYHTKIRDGTNSFAAAIEGTLPRLVGNAAAFLDCPKQAKKIQDLLSLWQEKGYYSDETLDKLKVVAREAPMTSLTTSKKDSTDDRALQNSEDVPWALPSAHGDPSTPWYDLPAANWLPLLEPNSTRPMNPDMVRPLQMNSDVADQSLVDAVKCVLDFSHQIYSKDGSRANDNFNINDMGERVEIDEITGDVVSGETYYGWSRILDAADRGAEATAVNAKTHTPAVDLGLCIDNTQITVTMIVIFDGDPRTNRRTKTVVAARQPITNHFPLLAFHRLHRWGQVFQMSRHLRLDLTLHFNRQCPLCRASKDNFPISPSLPHLHTSIKAKLGNPFHPLPWTNSKEATAGAGSA
ncbi:hypothetical protein MKZ38_005803 [Zalerion maritima]|uniref:CID domain-containing protein n=1 Tax=Zalerion maritima TaxID=339359 RepID=A0AAD5RVZ5_9PEZI|nr:hypothetical protein MKZ38_005803 [Zalerion maritima]